MNSLGVMQGRLLPKYKGRYQAHPVGYWDKEFEVASGLNLQFIEFIFDYNEYELNPLYSKLGINNILRTIEKTSVGVRSVCADFLMESPFHSKNPAQVEKSQLVITNLLSNLASLEVKDLVIPCVDQSSLVDENDFKRFIINIQPVIELACKYDINLSLETDLHPIVFGQFLDLLPSRNVTVNYDTGNSASLGFNPIEEFSVYGKRISDIHIKDRKLNLGSFFLGTGDVRFDLFFEALKSINYNSPFILQVFRDDEGVSVFKQQMEIFQNLIQKYQ
jgi:L-ribulose-5-phosphate 3-epimerase